MINLNKYEVKYIDEEGNNKTSYIYVENIDEAIEKISSKYTDVLEINLVKFYLVNKYLSKDKISDSLICEFCDGLGVLLKSGVSIQRALQILKNQSKNAKYKEKLNLIEFNILEGNSLSYSLKEVGMPSFMYNLVMVGEESGKLENTLKLIYEYYYDKNKVKEIVKNATYYPMVVVIAMIIAIWICVVNVIPTYAQMFKSNNQQLPLATQILFDISNFFINNFNFIMLCGAFILLLAVIFLNSKIGVRILDYLKLNLNGFKKIYLNLVNYNFCICMYMLLESSIDIIRSLTITEEVINNEIVSIHIEEIKNNLENGMPLSYSLSQYKEFDLLLISLCEIGEESGTLVNSFYKCSNTYKKNMEKFLNKLQRKIEVTVTIILGIVLGFIMISIILPTYSIINTI